MANSILPVARALMLCDSHFGHGNGKVDLTGVFNAIRPRNGYPHVQNRFSVFCQLTNGMGSVPFLVDVHHLETDRLVWTTATHRLHFPSRTKLVYLAAIIENCRFDRPGLHAIELFCDNTWVCDTSLLLE